MVGQRWRIFLVGELIGRVTLVGWSRAIGHHSHHMVS